LIFLIHKYPQGIGKKMPSKKGELIVDKYRCMVCGYIYDPVVGDSTQRINPGIAFQDLPDTWVCPECGVGKDMFEKI